MKLAGTVVLYNPDREVLENIQTYLPFIDVLYVMDNSTKEYDFLDDIKKIKKVKYISLDGNKGIAEALKVATETAIDEGFDCILTMDQDSKYPTDDFNYIKEYIDNADISNVGIMAINYTDSQCDVINEDKKYTEKINLAISSGMMIFLDKYKKVEGFHSELFIDCVDFDICLQMIDKSFDILLFRNIMLNHKLGEPEKRKFLFLERTKPWHTKLRYYYMFRNYHYLKKNKKYFKNVDGLKRHFSWIAIIYQSLFSKEKINTFKMILRGIRDGKKGILGPYQERRK